MSAFVIDASVAMRLAADPFEIAADVELYAPTYLCSETLSLLHEAAHAGELAPATARDRLDWMTNWFVHQPVRLLGDAVLKAQAWKVADRLGWPSTYAAEYVAMAILRRCPLITLDKALARQVTGLVEIASIDDLRK
jgi:indolepyruvate ferredoxin oxidoreductase alpha subunit